MCPIVIRIRAHSVLSKDKKQERISIMTGDYKFRFIPGILYSMFTLLLLSGCIAENNDDCFKGVPLKVKLPAGISQETIKDMSLYVYDDKDLLLDILPVNSTEPVNLNYPGIPTLHCVVLCNTQDGTMLVSPLKKGDLCSDDFIEMKPSAPTRDAQSIYYTPPADLFYGELKIENTSTSARVEEQTLAVSRMVASMNITVRGLVNSDENNDGGYWLVVRETASRLDFEGHYGGTPVSYRFSPPFEAGKDYKIPLFNLFPTLEENKGLTIEIHHNDDLLGSLDVDSNHQPIIPVVGQTLNVLLDFKLSVSVEVKLTKWGVETVWKEYN